jgi:hypothetical protein
MRSIWLVLLGPLALAACGSDEKPVVVTAPPQVITVPQAQQPVVVVPDRR